MGILNITPDSFFDGGQLFDERGVALSAVLQRAEGMIDQGAKILDVGGESTRPGAVEVTPQQEMDRVLPVIEAVTARFDTIVSIDTSSAGVIREAARAGAGLINDVRALRGEAAMRAAADTGLPVCLMHMQGSPDTMQGAPHYENVLQEVTEFFMRRIEQCVAVGIRRDQILIDPGFGFGKSLQHNLLLFRQLDVLVGMGYPVLVGVSRKSMIGALTARPVEDRMAGSLALATMAALQGVAVLRVHDVPETRDVVKMVNEVMNK